MRRIMLLFSVLLVALTLITSVHHTAFASSSSDGKHHSANIQASFYNCGGTCENKDPYATGCRNGASIATHTYVKDEANSENVMEVDNWYSPNCGTNWAVAYLLDKNYNHTYLTIENTGSNVYHCYPDTPNCDFSSYYTGSAYPIWTNMTFAPSVEAIACGWALAPNNAGEVNGCVGA